MIGDYNYSAAIKNAFLMFINQEREINHISHDSFFFVYLNNLSNLAVTTIRQGLKDYSSYVGYFDLTFSSPIKHVLSSILVRAFVKNKNQIIVPDEITGKHNPTLFDFEKHGFQCYSIESLCYDIFLSYKIERPAQQLEEDIRFSLNAVSVMVLTLSDFDLVIEEAKMQYLMTEKRDNF